MGSCFSSPRAVVASVHRDSFRKVAADFVQRPASAARIGDKEPLVSNSIFEKHAELYRNFSSVRLTGTETLCRDRDCFYRSVMFAYVEHILETQAGSEVSRMLRRLERYRKITSALLGDGIAFDHLFMDFKDLLKTYSKGKRGFARKKELMTQCSSRYLTILLLRLLVAAEIHTPRDDYPIDFLPLYGSLEEFCSDRVLPIGSNHLHASILSRALGVPIRVIDIRSISDYFPKKPILSKRQFEIILLYRADGHYDILYSSLSDREIFYAVVDREYTRCCGLSAWLFKGMYTFD